MGWKSFDPGSAAAHAPTSCRRGSKPGWSPLPSAIAAWDRAASRPSWRCRCGVASRSAGVAVHHGLGGPRSPRPGRPWLEAAGGVDRQGLRVSGGALQLGGGAAWPSIASSGPVDRKPLGPWSALSAPSWKSAGDRPLLDPWCRSSLPSAANSMPICVTTTSNAVTPAFATAVGRRRRLVYGARKMHQDEPHVSPHLQSRST